MVNGTPRAEVSLDAAGLATLLRDQAPAWADCRIEAFAEGWDNTMFRLYPSHLARLPRRQSADALLQNELRLLPFVAARLAVPIPVPVHSGRPDRHFPWHWSIVPYFEATTASDRPLNPDGCMQWASCLAELHRPYSPDRDPHPPVNPHRGVPLEARRTGVVERLAALADLDETPSPELFAIWEEALAEPPSNLKVWLHGDPHPGNVLSHEGALAAVVDWGDITVGDPAGDLGSFWMLISDPVVRAAAIDRYLAGITYDLSARTVTSLFNRARGWAFIYGVILLSSGLVDNPAHAAVGRTTLANLSA